MKDLANGYRQDTERAGSRMAVLTTGRLPVRLTPLVGRESELGEVTRLLAGCRLLTLTGPGGGGKTRLALAAAARLAAAGPAGVPGGPGADVAWVELAALNDPQVIAVAVAAALGLPETPGLGPAAAIAAHLSARRDATATPVLIVLDNCEHLAAEAAGLAEHLLAECPALTILATSREPLGVEGERSWPVPPLDRAHAAALFEDRARLVAPSFAITDGNRQAVNQVCERLDGLPLAIELAAAKLRVLSVRQLAERLDDVFGVLVGGARSAPPRHQALRATLDWSHDLLSAAERSVFRRLATFAGGFALPAAERIAAFGDVEAGQVLGLLARLADKSLLRLEDERYHLLATIREYAAERLAAAGEQRLAGAAHLAYYTEFAERAGARVEHAPAAELEAELDQLDQEKPNLRAAIQYARGAGDAESALRIVGQLGRYAYLRGHYHEVREWMDQAVADGPAAPPRYRATALYGSGRLAHLQCDYGPALARLNEALRLYRGLGDAAGTAACLQALGSVAREQGRYALSARLHTESLELAIAAGDRRAEASARGYLGFVAWLRGDLVLAAAESGRALAAFRALGDAEGTAWSLLSLGVVARYQGEPSAAASLLRESREQSRAIGFREGIAWCEEQLGLVALDRGDLRDAAARLRSSYATHRDLRDRWRMASVLEAQAAVAVAAVNTGDAVCPGPVSGEAAGAGPAGWERAGGERAGREAAYPGAVSGEVSQGNTGPAERATWLLGLAEATRAAIGTVIAPCEASQHQRSVAAAKAVLGEPAFAAAWQRGATASDPDQFTPALSQPAPPTPPPPAPAPPAALSAYSLDPSAATVPGPPVAPSTPSDASPPSSSAAIPAPSALSPSPAAAPAQPTPSTAPAADSPAQSRAAAPGQAVTSSAVPAPLARPATSARLPPPPAAPSSPSAESSTWPATTAPQAPASAQSSASAVAPESAPAMPGRSAAPGGPASAPAVAPESAPAMPGRSAAPGDPVPAPASASPPALPPVIFASPLTGASPMWPGPPPVSPPAAGLLPTGSSSERQPHASPPSDDPAPARAPATAPARPARRAAAAGRPSGPLRVRALGRATVEVGGTALTAADWGYAKPRELLFLLITSPPQTREQLRAALWPELSPKQLGNALHTALRELRRALGDHEWIVYAAGHYTVNRDRAFDCDVDTFESSLASAGRARPAAAGLPDLRRAVAAYGGDFLDGMLAGEWAGVRRGELRRRFETALLATGRLHAAAGNHQVAVTAFRRAVEHEPLNESAHRELMTCWASLGETARAVRHYAELTALLRARAGVPPAAETTALYERLAGGRGGLPDMPDIS